MKDLLDWYNPLVQFLAAKIRHDPTSVGAQVGELPELTRKVLAGGEQALYYFCGYVSGYLEGCMLIPSCSEKARVALNLEPDVAMMVLTVDYDSELKMLTQTDARSEALRDLPYFYELTPEGIRFVGQVHLSKLLP